MLELTPALRIDLDHRLVQRRLLLKLWIDFGHWVMLAQTVAAVAMAAVAVARSLSPPSEIPTE